jgi:hypothetical protein
MFVSSCTESRCMCINVSDLVFPMFIVWHRCYGKRSRFSETVCGGEFGWCYQPGGQPEHSSCLCLEALPRQTWRPIVEREVRREWCRIWSMFGRRTGDRYRRV